MRIQSIHSQNLSISNKGYFKAVYKSNTEPIEANVLHRNNTTFLREDYNLKSVITFLARKFKDTDRVAFYDYACSNGLEAYSYLLGMDTFLKQETEKFLPILARDYDQDVIDEAQKKVVDIWWTEKCNVSKKMMPYFKENFHQVSYEKYEISNKYSSSVDFKVGDITKDYTNLPKENVILSVRNCWPYFTKENQLYLPEKLCNHFERNVVIILGAFDLKTQQVKDFLKNGFKKANLKNKSPMFYK